MQENDLTKLVIGLCLKIHKTLGPGLLETVYEEVLVHEIRKLGIAIARQVGIPVQYENVILDLGFRVDLIIDDKVILELKSVETVLPIHKKQLLTYLKLTGKRIGLLINFNETLMKNGITRIANGM